MKNKKHTIFKILRILGKILAGILVFLILVILFVRSPWGQDIIKDKFLSSITDKTDTRLEIEKLFITFSGNLQLNGLYAEDQQGDTLVYSKTLEADIELWPLIQGTSFNLDNLKWSGVRANITRQDSVEGFNYQFLVDAFMPADTTTTAADTTGAAMGFSIGGVDLRDIKLKFKDDVTGIDSRLELGSLEVDMNKTDLENMEFRVDQAELSNTSFNYVQTKPFPPSDPKEETPLPLLVVDQLALNNVKAYYKSEPDGILLDAGLNHFRVEMPLANLAENIIRIDNVELENSNVLVRMSTPLNSTEKAANPKPADSAEAFQWPEYTLIVDEIAFSNNNISYFADSAKVKQNEFNPNALVFKNLDLQAKEIYLQDKTAGAEIDKLNFNEASGIDLNEMALKLEADNTRLALSQLNFAANGNKLKGEMSIQYDSLADFIEKPENARMALDLPEIKVDLNDIYRFQPSLKENQYMQSLSSKPISGSLTASGPLSRIQIPNANFSWGANTQLSARGLVTNSMDPEKIAFDFPQFQLNTRKADLVKFVDEEQMGLDLPQQVRLSGNFSGTPQDIQANATLNSSDGNIILDGGFDSSGEIAFNADVQVEELQLGKLLKNPLLGPISMQLDATGQGADVNSLDATMEASISSFQYNNYEIQDLNISGELEDGAGNINSEYKDQNINAILDAYVELDSVSPRINADLNLKGANLQALGITTGDIRVAMNLNADFKGNSESYDLNASIRDGVAVYDNETYLLGELDASAYVRPDSTSVDINNRMVDLTLHSNASPAAFSAALQRHYQSYFDENPATDTVQDPVNLELRGTIVQAPIMNEVFLPNLEELDTVNINVDFSENKRTLVADVKLPSIRYMGAEIDSLALTLDSDKTNFDFDFGFNALNAGPLAIKQTNLTGDLQNQQLNLDFLSTYNDSTLVHVQPVVRRKGDTLNVHIDPSELILNRKEWSIPQDNQIVVGSDFMDFRDFTISRNNQQFQITNNQPGVEKENIALSFNNFNLAGFLNYLNPQVKLATGNLNGDLVLEEPFGKTGIIAGLDIKDFRMMDVNMGTLSLDAESIGNQRYTMDLGVKGGQVDLDLTGDYQAQDTTAVVNMNLELNKVEMTAMEGFSQGAIEAGSGSYSGNIEISGTMADPQYDGYLHFEDAGFTISMLSAGFYLENETLELDNEGIYLDNFTISDDQDNGFVIDGDIYTENLLNPTFDLSFNAENFQVLNSTEEDNDLFYGTASFDVDATLKGSLNLPQLDMDLDVGPNTNITYVIPEAQLAMQEREGIVMFVNKENPDAILTQTEEESEIFSGYDIDALLSVDEDAVIKIVLDEETGDHIQVKGEGDLNMNLYPNGRTTLTGRYDMTGGHYEMSLYGLVKRRFDIADGSTITWAGDPFNASLDIRAIYNVETSASSLMAYKSAGSDTNITNQFRRELPFLVYLNIGGELMEPKISFGLDMPEDVQGFAGGQVYGQIQQLNSQEQELNKQVFSLLVLNRFYPAGGSDGSQGGMMSVARDNLNEALSDQLNVFSDRLLGDTGVNLNFGVDSYTDYQGDTPQERTQLDIAAEKTFFDERLKVSVGSEVDVQGSNRNPDEETPVIGNVSLEYLLTKDGRFRLKGFRRNEFENVIDGQLIVSGIALIFTREFNEFRQLWKSLLDGTVEEENKEEEK